MRFGFGSPGHALDMAEEDELIRQAHESLEATEELREESGLADEEAGRTGEDDDGEPAADELLDSPPEPWAKTSSGDTDNP